MVYEATDTRNEERIALKVLLPHAAEEADGLLRFKREFRALARLRHPNIVRVLDAGIENDVPFIAMEFLDGKDARRHLKAVPEGPVRDREAKRILRQIFGALAHIHARRIVHRDLKPENIIVCSDGRVKLMDFGVARLLRAPTSSSGLLGTFAYMAPEQVQGGEIDGRSDLYAVGVLLYELLTGEYPFPVEPPAAALHHHVNTRPDDVLTVTPEADPTLAALTKILLEKDPMDRLQTAEEAFAYLAEDEESGAHVDPVMPAQLFAPQFVGRKAELTTLLGVVEDAEAGCGRVVVLDGPSGIGKSRLIKELQRRISRQTNLLMRGQCTAESAQPYAPVQGVLDEIAAIAARAAPDVLKKIVGRDAALVAAVSPRLARLGGPVTTGNLDATERKVRMHKAIVGVIGRLALTRPLLLVVEDVHWADSPTLELLWDASRTLLAPRPGGARGETVCPVTLVLTRRALSEGPDASEGLIRRLDERGLVTNVSLGPMEVNNVADMARTMTGAPESPAALIEELVKATHGRPLMVQEVMESWAAGGILERVSGAWHFRGEPLGQEALPTPQPPKRLAQAKPKPAPRRRSRSRPKARVRGADEVALSKLDPLSPHARALLERLSLLGRLLSSELISALGGPDESTFLDAMDEVVRANLLVEDVSHEGVRYRFYHEGFREAVVRALPAKRKVELHGFIARALERAFVARRGELAHVLARHFKAAERPERAVRYLRRMASAAAARGDLEGALRRLEDAMSIIDERPRTQASATRRLTVLLQQIDLLLDFGRAQDALGRADPQVGLQARSPEVMSAELGLKKARAQFALGQLDATLATLMTQLDPAPSRSLGARFLELEGRTRLARGEFEDAHAVLKAGHDVAREAGLHELAERLDATLGVVLFHQGLLDEALEKLERGLARARACEDQREEADLLGHVGLAQAARGREAEAIAYLRDALELAEVRGFRTDIERWSGELGRLLSDMDQEEEARQHLQEARDMAADAGSRQSEATWRGELGLHLLNSGALEEAGRELQRCLAISRDIGARRCEARARMHLGGLCLEENYDAVDEALEHIRAGLEITEDLQDPALEAEGLIFLARACRAQSNRRRARDVLDQARRIARGTNDARLLRKVKVEIQSLN